MLVGWGYSCRWGLIFLGGVDFSRRCLYHPGNYENHFWHNAEWRITLDFCICFNFVICQSLLARYERILHLQWHTAATDCIYFFLDKNGQKRSEPIYFDKITSRIKKLCYGLDMNFVKVVICNFHNCQSIDCFTK